MKYAIFGSSFAGGLLWMIVWAMTALLPEAPSGQYRDGVEQWHGLLVLSIVLIAFGQLMWIGDRKAQLGRTAKLSMSAVIAGELLVGFGRLIQIYGADPQPWAGIGWILTAVSLLACGLVLGRRSPLWLRAAMITAAICFGLLSDLDWRAWLALPFGILWPVLTYSECVREAGAGRESKKIKYNFLKDG